MTGTVLVTGGFGLVGSATVRRLTELGRHVVATDLDTPANRKAVAQLPGGAEARWADLTDRNQAERLVAEVAPEAIIHLAAIIPPPIYRNPKLARCINVDATATLCTSQKRNRRPRAGSRRRATRSSAHATRTGSPHRFARMNR